MDRFDAARELLYGVTALRMGLIERPELVLALTEWAEGRDLPLSAIFLQRGMLGLGTIDALAGRFDALLEDFRGDPHPALAASGPIVEELGRLVGLAGDPGMGTIQPLGASIAVGPNAGPATVASTGQDDGGRAEVEVEGGGLGSTIAGGSEAPESDSWGSGSSVTLHTIGDHPVGEAAGTAPAADFSAKDDDPASLRYRILRLHARGGLGEVFVARDSELNREVALKEIQDRHAHDTESRSRFLIEAEVTGGLEHPGIVPVYGLGQYPDGRPYYAMRFIRGESLKEAIARFHKTNDAGQGGRELPFRQLLGQLIDVCDAMAYAHSRGVLHRDLKPANIMLGAFGETLVVDWGLAKFQDTPEEPTGGQPNMVRPMSAGSSSQTLLGSAVGTPQYMSPEQAEGKHDELGPPSDIYSLGAILYEILTGKMPFRGANAHEVLQKVREGEIVRPRSVAPAAPPALEAVCLRAMSKRPEDRYASATDLASEVRRWLADEPVEAYRDPWTTRLVRWGRRHKTAVTATAALLITAVTALSISTVLVRRERNEARVQREQARGAVDEMYTEVAEKWLEDRLDPLQKRFLERALTYYEEFAGQDASEPVVRQERGRAYLRMGDILRKLGKPEEAERAYRRAIEILGRLEADFPAWPEPRHHLAHGRDRLGLVLAARGANDEAEPLYRRALEAQEGLATSPAPVPRSRLHLAKTHKDLADLLRVTGRLPDAETSYRRSSDLLRTLAAADLADVESRQDLAAALDRLGLLLKETGRRDEARATFAEGLEVLQGLAADFPTLPRLRENLANGLRSMALFLQEDGKGAATMPYLRRALEVTERLAADFPRRPEFRRDMAKSRLNLASQLWDAGDLTEAERQYRMAAETYEALAVEVPGVVQYRQDLARAQSNLGLLLRMVGNLPEAEKAGRRAVEIYRGLVADVPDVPGYRQALADSLANLGAFLASIGKAPDAETAYRQAIEIDGKLAGEFPSLADHRKAMARALTGLGNLMRRSGRYPDAETAYRQAVEIDEKLAGDFPAVAAYRASLANDYNSLGGLRLVGFEDSYRKALAIDEALVAGSPGETASRMSLAIVHNNLGEALRHCGRGTDAEPSFRRAEELLGALAAAAPRVADYQGQLGEVEANLGRLAYDRGKTTDAVALFDLAALHQQAALAINPKSPTYRRARDEALARLMLAKGSHSEASRVAKESLSAASDRRSACLEAARILSRCVPLAESDKSLAEPRGKALAEEYAYRAIELLREAIALGPPGSGRPADDPDFEPLRTRDDFKTLPTTPEKAAAGPG